MSESLPSAATPGARRSFWKKAALVTLGLVLAYLVIAYVVMPAAWKTHARRHPGLVDIPGITHTAD